MNNPHLHNPREWPWNLTPEGTNKLVRQIQAYWLERGYPNVKCHIDYERSGFPIRSNLVNGWPPGGV